MSRFGFRKAACLRRVSFGFADFLVCLPCCSSWQETKTCVTSVVAGLTTGTVGNGSGARVLLRLQRTSCPARCAQLTLPNDKEDTTALFVKDKKFLFYCYLLNDTRVLQHSVHQHPECHNGLMHGLGIFLQRQVEHQIGLESWR